MKTPTALRSRALAGVDPDTAADYAHLAHLARTHMASMTDAEVIRYQRLRTTLPDRVLAAIEKSVQR